MRANAFVLTALAVSALAAPQPARRITGGIGPGPTTASDEGLRFRLSEGADEDTVAARPSPAPATPLDERETQKILDRLPPLTESPDDSRDFAWRESSLPPPRTGRTVKDPFPPSQSTPPPDASERGPLRVLRHAPEGDVALAPNLSVTFAQPMVALASQDELARAPRPVRLAPEPPGQWRWVGARTLVFEPEGRFPMATEYRAEIPAGTRSATGGVLERPQSFTFRTPPPRVVRWHPEGGPVRRDALLLLAFDQRVDPGAVLAQVRLAAPGASPALRLATEEELRADEEASARAKAAGPGRFVAFLTRAPLPADASVQVSVAAGTPSAEGPRVTEKPQESTFRTFGPLRVTEHRCGWRDDCPPFTPWQVAFSNPLDAKAFRKEQVRVEPELPGLRVGVSGAWLAISGASRGRTTYRVTLSGAIRDVFGQALGDDVPLAFTVGSAAPHLAAQGGSLVILDPAGGARFPVYSVNHEALKLRLHAVTPADWPAFAAFLRALDRNATATPPGRAVFARTIPVASRPDELVETRIDLAPALANGLGHAVLVVEPVTTPKEAWRRRRVAAWIQVTRIGLDAFADDEQVLAWASSLESGRALRGVEVALLGGGVSDSTGDDGLARLALPAGESALLVARLGGDTALLPASTAAWREGGWRRQERRTQLRFFVFDDRGLYRPGEEARVKGFLRSYGPGKGGDVGRLPPGLTRVAFALRDSRGNDVERGETALSEAGGFDLTLKLPGAMNLGDAVLRLSAPGADEAYEHRLQVQEFRRPEFEVATTAGEGPHFVGEHATATVSARYFAGGGLPGAEVSWRVTATPASFRPPNREDFQFGRFVPWWEPFHGRGGRGRSASFSGRTDAAGLHRLRLDFDSVSPAQPTSVRVEAEVADVNRQAWSAASTLLVHPAALYVGLRSERAFVRPGQPLVFDAIACDLDGKAIAGRAIRLRFERLDWEQVDGEWVERTADVQERTLASAAEPARVRFEPRAGGPHRIVARVEDGQERANETELRVWVAGGTQPPRAQPEQEKVTLIPDKQEHRPGEAAEILVLAPFAPAEGLLTVRRSGIVRAERFTMTEGSHALRLPIEEGWTPNVHVQVDLVGAAPRAREDGTVDERLPRRPAFGSGRLDLAVPPALRTLALTVTPRERALEPGGSTRLDVSVRDASGAPVAAAEATIVVVDEAVLALTGYRVPDPIGVFYSPRPAGTSDHRSRQSVLLARPETLSESMAEAGPDVAKLTSPVAEGLGPPAPAAMARAAGAMADAAPAPIRARADFSALALFAARVATGADGRAQVEVRVPDSLTRYRVMAVAADGSNRFGSGESSLTARLPLMLRPSPPRFLSFGDRFELPLVIQNQTDAALRVDVAARAANAELPRGSGWRVEVPANDRVELRVPAAARSAGTARFQFGASAGRFADAALVSLPVFTPATAEAFASYGEIDQGAVAQPVRAPAGALPQFGGLELTTSATALQSLTDAVLYLVAYPFECAEQLSSRVVAVAALKDVLGAFRAEGLPTPEEMQAAVARDVLRLRALQNDDGGFAFWRRGDPSWPYVSIHAALALERARAKGFDVPAPMLERSRGYLREVERRIPREYPQEARRTLVAYALHVRERLGDADPGRARALVREAGADGLPLEAAGWLLPVLGADPGSRAEAEQVRVQLANRVTETAGAAHFVTSYSDGGHLLLHSDRRADAVVLEALIRDQPASDLVPKLVAGLLAHRKAGRWTNTQENAFVLLALDRYFEAYEKTTPDFVARAWLGERMAAEHAFRGRTTDRHHVDVPMRLLAPDRPLDLVIAKDGPGRLYYRVGLRYALAALRLAAADRGFTVTRRYEAVESPGDVARLADGSWRIRAGARVRVRLALVAPARRYHVALVDPLPAGLEALNPGLAGTGASGEDGPPGPGLRDWWRPRPWFEHQNLRDERVEAFASLLWEGVYDYSYLARATTPGMFLAAPARAEEMYAPETFGRTGTDRVVVE